MKAPTSLVNITHALATACGAQFTAYNEGDTEQVAPLDVLFMLHGYVYAVVVHERRELDRDDVFIRAQLQKLPTTTRRWVMEILFPVTDAVRVQTPLGSLDPHSPDDLPPGSLRVRLLQ